MSNIVLKPWYTPLGEANFRVKCPPLFPAAVAIDFAIFDITCKDVVNKEAKILSPAFPGIFQSKFLTEAKARHSASI